MPLRIKLFLPIPTWSFFVFFCCLNLSLDSAAQRLLVTPLFSNSELKGVEFYNLLEDQRGFLWVGSDRGVFRYDGTHLINYTIKQGLLSNDVFDVNEDQEGRIWFSMYEQGLAYYDYKQDSLIVPDWNGQLVAELKNSWVADFAISADGNFWIQKFAFPPYTSIDVFAIKDSSFIKHHLTKPIQVEALIRAQNLSSTEKKFFDIIQVSLNLAQNRAHTIHYKDSNYLSLNNDNLFIENSSGEEPVQKKLKHICKKLVQLKNQKILILAYQGFLNFSKNDTNLYLSQYHINDVLQLKNGVYVFSTSNKGLLACSSIDIETYNLGTSNELVSAIEQEKNDLYIQTNQAIYKKNRATDKIEIIVPSLKRAKTAGLPHTFFVWNDLIFNRQTLFNSKTGLTPPKLIPLFNNIVSLTNGRDKSINLISDSLLIISTAKGFILLDRTLKVVLNSKDLGYDTWTYSSTQINDQELWLGTIDGLVSYNLSTKVIKKIPPTIQNLTVQHLKGSQQNGIFVGSKSHGLLVFQSSNQPIVISTQDNLSANDVRSILIENDSSTWIGTSNGINKIVFDANKTDYQVHSYLTGQLIKDIALVGDSIFAVTDGQLLVFHKNISPVYKSSLDFYLTQFTANGKKQLYQNSLIQLQRHQNNIRIEFTDIAFDKLRPTTFCYALVPKNELDTNWLYTQDYAVNYSKLAPQEYSFLLTTKEELKKSNPKVIALAINIQQHFVDTIYYQLLIYLLIILGISLIAFIVILIVKRRADLKRSLVESQLKLLRTQMNPHFIFNALNSILGHITMQDLWTSTMYLSSFADLVRQVLENSRYSFLPLQEEIEMLKLYTELEKLRLGDDYTILIEVNDNNILNDFQIPPMLIQPFIENAIIHGVSPNEEGTISIAFNKKTANLVEIIITDNGIGRTAAAKINRSFGEYKQTSFGIANVRERIAIIKKTYGVNIQFSIEDLQNAGQAEGTAIHILLPKFALVQKPMVE